MIFRWGAALIVGVIALRHLIKEKNYFLNREVSMKILAVIPARAGSKGRSARLCI